MARKKQEPVSADVVVSSELTAADSTAPVNVLAAPAFPVKKHERLDKLLSSATLQAISKKHGAGLIRRMSEHQASVIKYIPSGIFPLDYALGGGFRVGGIHTVWGKKSSGKTTTICKTIASAQQMCANCWSFVEYYDEKTGEVLKKVKCECGKYRDVVVAYLDVEGTLDIDWIKSLGVDTDRLTLSVPEYAEQSLDIGEALLRSGDLDILVCDSIAFLTPAKEIEESTAKELMGVQPRVVGKGIRKFVAALNQQGNSNERRPTVFFTNQVRNKLGVMFGSPDTMPGGMAPQFAATTETKFLGGKVDREEDKEAKKDKAEFDLVRPVTVDIPFRVEKNKQGVPMMEGSYKLMLVSTENKRKGDVVDEATIMDAGEKAGVVKKEGSKIVCGDFKFDSRSAMEAHMIKSPAFKRELEKLIIHCLSSN